MWGAVGSRPATADGLHGEPMSIKRFATTRDENEAPIVEALRKAGFYVRHQDEPCDLLVGRGLWHQVEVKLPLGPSSGSSHSKLTDSQVAFGDMADSVGCCFHTVRDPEDAIRQLRACRGKWTRSQDDA